MSGPLDAPVAQARPSTPGRVWHAVAGAAVSLVFMWFAARDVEWRAFLHSMSGVRWPLLLAGVVISSSAYFAMALRWRVLLGSHSRLSVGDVFDFTMIGFLSGLVLPLRLGDLVKSVVLGRKANLGGTAVLGSVVLERLLDVIMLVTLAGLLGAFVELPMLLTGGLAILATVAGGCLVLLLASPYWTPVATSALRWVPGPALAVVSRLVERGVIGVHAVRNPRQFGLALLLAAGVWILSGIGMTAYVAAFGLNVPWYCGLLVLLTTNLAGILPASPGSIGVYHYAAVFAVTIWSPDRAAALSFALVTHAIALMVVGLFGAWSLSRQGMSLGALRNLAGKVSEG